MQQVLFRIPPWNPDGLPLYGFGMMLFITFLVCIWISIRKAEQNGVSKEFIQDLAIWIFLGGLLGARVAYVIFHEKPTSIGDFFFRLPRIWDGGIIFYGSVLGALAAYALGYLLVFRNRRVSTLKLADILAPGLAVGLCLGRIGCFLNGCCYGQVACPTCPAVSFPLSAPAAGDMVHRGYQTTAGFTIHAPAVIREVSPVSAASELSSPPLRDDVIVQVNERRILSIYDLEAFVRNELPAKEKRLILKVQRDGKEIELPPLPLPSSDRPKELTALTGLSLVSPSSLPAKVDQVAPRSGAFDAGLENGDVIVEANGQEIKSIGHLSQALTRNWPRGGKELSLTVERKGKKKALPAFIPRTRGLHPTQLYEAISMGLLLLVLLAYHPFRQFDGQVMAVMMIAYGVHRYVNEILRIDERPVGFESWGSVVALVGGLLLFTWKWWLPWVRPKTA